MSLDLAIGHANLFLYYFIKEKMLYFPGLNWGRGVCLLKCLKKVEKAKTEKSKKEKALSESGMVRADATCLLKIPPELLTERESLRRQ